MSKWSTFCNTLWPLKTGDCNDLLWFDEHLRRIYQEWKSLILTLVHIFADCSKSVLPQRSSYSHAGTNQYSRRANQTLKWKTILSWPVSMGKLGLRGRYSINNSVFTYFKTAYDISSSFSFLFFLIFSLHWNFKGIPIPKNVWRAWYFAYVSARERW